MVPFLRSLCPTRYAIGVVDLSHDCFNDVFSIKTRKIRRNKIRLHNWSVKEHQERGSDLISSGYVSRLSSQLEMRSEGHCFLH